MIKTESNLFGQTLYLLYPGDYMAVTENCIMTSVSGATVIVCLYDLNRGIGGMGHFIVPGKIGTDGIIASDIAGYGIQSMELLITEIVKKGGDRKYLKAKLFGAGYIKENIPDTRSVQESNINFLHEYFAMENIQIVKEDLGGNFRRQIYFFPLQGKVLRRFQKRKEDSSEFRIMEKEYIDNIFRNREQSGRVIIFK